MDDDLCVAHRPAFLACAAFVVFVAFGAAFLTAFFVGRLAAFFDAVVTLEGAPFDGGINGFASRARAVVDSRGVVRSRTGGTTSPLGRLPLAVRFFDAVLVGDFAVL